MNIEMRITMSTNQVNTRKITIKENEGLTHGLKRLVESMPNSVISDGKITLKEWNTVIDKLILINEQRKQSGKESIFTGGPDRKDYRHNFVVHPEQEIEFTENEINELFEAMGVTISNQEQHGQQPGGREAQAPAPAEGNNPPVADTTRVEQPTPTTPVQTVPADSTELRNNRPVVEPPIIPADTTRAAQRPQPAPIQEETPVDMPAQTEKTRFSLSWGEIGKQALKSTGKFFKGMFCDENGFSLKRTAVSIGVIAGLVFAAPAAAALGASAAVVGGIALTAKVIGVGIGAYAVCSGGKKAIEGTKEYYNAETREQAEQAMEKAMDGGSELWSMAIMGGATKASSKLVGLVGKVKSAPKPAPKPAPAAESIPKAKPTQSVNAEPVAEPKPAAAAKPTPEVKPTTEAKPTPSANAEPVAEPKPAPTTESTPVAEPTVEVPEANKTPKTNKSKKGLIDRFNDWKKARKARREEAHKAEEARKAREARKANIEETRLASKIDESLYPRKYEDPATGELVEEFIDYGAGGKCKYVIKMYSKDGVPVRQVTSQEGCTLPWIEYIYEGGKVTKTIDYEFAADGRSVIKISASD